MVCVSKCISAVVRPIGKRRPQRAASGEVSRVLPTENPPRSGGALPNRRQTTGLSMSSDLSVETTQSEQIFKQGGPGFPPPSHPANAATADIS